MNYRLRNIVLAVLLAVLAAVLTGVYVTSYKGDVDAGNKPTDVFVAKHDIPPGTPASKVSDDFEKRTVAEKDVVPGAVAGTDDVKGQVSSQWIYAGEQVSARRFTTPSQAGVRAELRGTYRAYAIQGSQQQLLAGILKNGDHVDLMGSFEYHLREDASNTFWATRIVLRDVKVIRAPSGVTADAKLGGSLDQSYTAVLALTDSQAQKLAFTIANAKKDSANKPAWSLELRPVADAADSPQTIETLGTILRDGLSRRGIGQIYGKYGGGTDE